MPAIMTAHMAKSSTRWVASQVSVIIQADAPVMGPYMSRAIGTIHAQLNTIATTSAAPTSSRSRRSSDSTEVREIASGLTSADDAVGAPVYFCEVGMGPVEVQLDRPFGPALSADELGLRELEACGQCEIGAMLGACHRVPDGPPFPLDPAGPLPVCGGGPQVDAEIDRFEEGGEHFRDRRR